MTEQETDAPRRYVGVAEVAETFAVPTGWVYKAAASGLIPSIKLGKYRRFRLADVLAALEDNESSTRRKHSREIEVITRG